MSTLCCPTKGLELLQTLLDTPERLRQELSLQLTLGAALGTAKGHAAPEVETAYTRRVSYAGR